MKNNIHSLLLTHLKNNPDIIWAFDLDDTIVHTQAKVIDYINSFPQTVTILKEKGMYPLKYEDVTDFFYYHKLFGEEIAHKVFSFPELYDETLLLKDGIIDLINFISKNFGKDKIKVVTASFEGVEAAKDEYVIKHLGLEKNQIIHAKDKHPHIKETIYFDDGFHNFNSVLDCDNTIKICMKTPWNKEELNKTDKIHYSIEDFKEILNILKDISPYLKKKNKKDTKKDTNFKLTV